MRARFYYSVKTSFFGISTPTDSSLEKALNSSPKIHPGKYLKGLMEFSAVSTAHHILVFGGFTQTVEEVLWDHIQGFRIKIYSWNSLLILQFFYSADRPDVFSKSSNSNKPWMRNKFGKLISYWSDWGFIQGTLVKPRAWHRSLIVSTKPERIMHIGGDYGYESGQVIGGVRTHRKFNSLKLRLGHIYYRKMFESMIKEWWERSGDRWKKTFGSPKITKTQCDYWEAFPVNCEKCNN